MCRPKVTSVDDFLSGAFMEGEPVPESDSESEASEVDDDESFASLDDGNSPSSSITPADRLQTKEQHTQWT